MRIKFASGLPTSVTRLGDLLEFGQLFKTLTTINLPKSPTFLGNFCKGVKIYHFSSEIIFRQLLQTFGDFFWSHCGLPTYQSINQSIKFFPITLITATRPLRQSHREKVCPPLTIGFSENHSNAMSTKAFHQESERHSLVRRRKWFQKVLFAKAMFSLYLPFAQLHNEKLRNNYLNEFLFYSIDICLSMRIGRRIYNKLDIGFNMLITLSLNPVTSCFTECW